MAFRTNKIWFWPTKTSHQSVGVGYVLSCFQVCRWRVCFFAGAPQNNDFALCSLCLQHSTHICLIIKVSLFCFFFFGLRFVIPLTRNERHPKLGSHVRTERGQIDEVDERSGFRDFAGNVRRSFDVAGHHRCGHQSDGQRHYDVSGLREEHHPAGATIIKRHS